MQNEMNQLFAEGGVMQEGGTVDPVSGNDVPPGAMAEEVRDDIDAKLSEGEFVIPADVVRYIGLETLMKLRDKAKAGLQKMAEIGQMGNAEEVPDAEALHGGDDDSFSSEIDSIMSEEDGGEDRNYAEGGYVVPENRQLYRDAPIKGFEMVPMTNDSGQTIYIPFINGVAQLSVPTGYKVRTPNEQEPVAPVTPVDTNVPTQGGDGGGGGGDSGTGSTGGTTGSMSVDDAGLSTATSVSPTAVGVVGAVMGMMGVPGAQAVSIGKSSIAQALSGLSSSSAAAANQSAMAAQMGLTPADAATTTGIAATASAVDSLSASPVGTTAATPGTTGTGGAAASAAASAAAAAAANGMSDAAIGAASQAAADAAVSGASASAAAAAGAAAANAADNGAAAEGGNTAANAAAAAAAAGAGAGSGAAGGGGGGCFLTTAAVEHMGHTDNGQLLNTLRDFRDNYMRKNKEASKDVAWYYENAPKIVKALDTHPDAKKIYRKMYNRFIMPSYLAIKMGKDDVAYGLYKKGINFARQEAGIKNEDIEPRYGKHGTTDADVKKHTGLGSKSKK